MKAAVAGIGWVTSAGKGHGAEGAPFGMPAGKLPHLTRRDVFAEPDLRFGRLDPFSRLGLAAIAFALRDAGLENAPAKRRIGIVAATSLGCLNTDLDYYATAIPQEGSLASPHLFAYTLPNVFLGEAAIRFGLTGPTYVVTQEGGGGLASLRLALLGMEGGEAEMMVAGQSDLEPAAGTGALPEPGALFFVLRREDGDVPPYGTVSLGRDGLLRRGRQSVTGLAALAAECLSGARRRGGPRASLPDREETP